jgi:hypothetical protein
MVMSRRSVLSGLVTSVAMLPCAGWAQTDGAQAVQFACFLPDGAGDADGRDWENAAPFLSVGRFAAQATPGQSFFLGVRESDTPEDWFGDQLLWDAGGTAEAPLYLTFGRVSDPDGFSLAASQDDAAVFRMIGNETEPGERPNVRGRPFVTFGPASSNLSIAGPAYDRSGANGFFSIEADGELRNLTFSDIHARQAGRVIETDGGTSLDGLTVERCSAVGLIRGFARFRDLSNAEFRDLDLDADFLDGGGGQVCQIIAVVRGRNLTFRRVRLANAINSLGAEERGSPYIQGDGLVLEEDTHDIRIEDCHASEMGDGGFDLKSEGVHMIGCTTTRCKLGIRIWSHHPGNLIESCVMTEPVSRPGNDGSCLWLAGNLTARDCTLHATEDMSPIRFGSGPDGTGDATLKIEGGEITHSQAATLVTGSAGDLELENVLVNGVATSGRYRWTGFRLRRQWL